jgi:hypothetical protein
MEVTVDCSCSLDELLVGLQFSKIYFLDHKKYFMLMCVHILLLCKYEGKIG